MKQGIGIKELAATLLRQAEAKRDFLVDTRAMRLGTMPGGGNGLTVMGDNSEDFLVNDFTHRQIADRLGIPAKYYDRMKQENPDLLHTNVNTWFTAKPETRLLRRAAARSDHRAEHVTETTRGPTENRRASR